MQEERRILDAIDTFFGPTIPQDTTETFATQHQLAMARIKEIRESLKSLGLMLCGGAINSVFTRNQINDLDFYLKDSSKIVEATEFLTKWFPTEIYRSTNAITFRRKSTKSNKKWAVQLITRFVGSPEKIMDDFDFTITQGVYDFENACFVLGPRFLPDISARRLVFLGKSHFPICALYRTLKYQKRGYTLPGSTVMHIGLSIVRLNIKNYRELKEQLLGIDTMFIQGLLSNTVKYADELPVDYGEFLVEIFESIDGTDPDQVFMEIEND